MRDPVFRDEYCAGRSSDHAGIRRRRKNVSGADDLCGGHLYLLQALVSLLSLQTALFAAFGQDSGELVPLMNALTGAGVCLMIWGIGIYMVRKSKKIQISG